MSAADRLMESQDDIGDEVERHYKEMTRLLSAHDGLVGEVEQELEDEKQGARDEGYDEGTAAEKGEPR